MAGPIIVNFAASGTPNPYVINLSGTPTGNYAENRVTVLVNSSGTIVLPAVSSLSGGNVDLFITTSNGSVTVAPASGDSFANPSGSTSLTINASGGGELTSIAQNTWFIRRP